MLETSRRRNDVVAEASLPCVWAIMKNRAPVHTSATVDSTIDTTEDKVKVPVISQTIT